MIKNITACTHVSFHSHSTLTSHSISFLSLIILILSGSGTIYEATHHAVFSNLWSYTSCSFLQFMKLHIMQFSPIYEPIHHAFFSNLWSYTSCSVLQFMKLYIMQFSPIYEAIHHAVFSNLYSYTSCSFLQFPICLSHKSLTTDQHQHCSQTQSTVYSHCHRTSATHTFRKILK